MVNFSKNFSVRTKYGAMATVVFASIYVAGAYLCRAQKICKEEHQGLPLTRSMSIAVLHGGQLALQRLFEYHEARADKSIVEVAECELRTHVAEQHPDYKKLQSVIGKLEMSGKEAQAVEILKNATAKARNEGRNHEAYEYEMLLVEMLIYKGDFGEALGRECLRHAEISDARRPLFKAIVNIIECNKNEATKYWREFNDLKEEFHCTPSKKESMEECQLHKLSTNFTEFEKVVLMLKKDIIKARAKRNGNKR